MGIDAEGKEDVLSPDGRENDVPPEGKEDGIPPTDDDSVGYGNNTSSVIITSASDAPPIC